MSDAKLTTHRPAQLLRFPFLTSRPVEAPGAPPGKGGDIVLPPPGNQVKVMHPTPPLHRGNVLLGITFSIVELGLFIKSIKIACMFVDRLLPHLGT